MTNMYPMSDFAFRALQFAKLALQYHPWYTVGATGFAVLSVWWAFKPPSPGKAVTAMGVVAVITTLRGEMSDAEKAVWIVFTFAFLFYEMRAVTQERVRSEAEFSRIGEGLRTAIDTSTRHFDETMRSIGSVFSSITGGDSYAVVVPLVRTGKSGNAIPMRIENRGAYMLTGVTVTVYNSGIWIGGTHDSIVRSINDRINVGVLAPSERLVLGPQMNHDSLMHTDSDGERFSRAFLHIAAQNFTVREYLDFKKNDKDQWLFRYMAYKYSRNDEVLLEAADWSEDPNSPARVTDAKWH